MFSISVTLLFGILLVLSSTTGANSNREPKEQRRNPKESRLIIAAKKWDPLGNKRRAIIFVLAALICLVLVFVSEMQARDNCVSGENSTWGFGQVRLPSICSHINHALSIHLSHHTDCCIAICPGTALEHRGIREGSAVLHSIHNLPWENLPPQACPCSRPHPDLFRFWPPTIKFAGTITSVTKWTITFTSIFFCK